MAQIVSPSAPPVRLSVKLCQAIIHMVREGMSQVGAAEKAGMSRQGLNKALKRAAVRDFLMETKTQFIAEVEGSRALYKARAFEVGFDLMMNAKSEAIRARMVEFLGSDGKVSPVSVHIDARRGGGYEYTRPGQRLVEIEGGNMADIVDGQVAV